MAQFRQSGGNNGLRNGVASDHVSINVRGGGSRHHHQRRSKILPPFQIPGVYCILTLLFILSVSAFFYFSLQSKGVEISRHKAQDDDMDTDMDFLMNVTRIDRSENLEFGHDSVAHDRDSHDWDKDDRRRDQDYNEEKWQRARYDPVGLLTTAGNGDNKSTFDKPYEAEYEASSKKTGESTDVVGKSNVQSGDVDGGNRRSLDETDEYDDGMDLPDDQMGEYDDARYDERDHSGYTKPHTIDTWDSSHVHHDNDKRQDVIEDVEKASNEFYSEEILSNSQHSEVQHHSERSTESQHARKLLPGRHSRSRKKSKHRKSLGICPMKTMNSTALLVEPLESPNFARFSLKYTEKEEKVIGDENWEPRFAGHQSLREREKSFIARDQKINCGFVKGPKGSPSTGFDLAEDDAKYIGSCHIAVSSCIFGNSDHLRSPMGRTVSRLSRKNVCFVMFIDEETLQSLSSEGQKPDLMGFIGLWKIVVVKNLPYTDMRRVGKIPKLLPHRLFTSARYSIWLDSKLRLQLDPLLILEYFLWRKGYEYAISNHYDRHCLWEEVAQNKRLNKYNHSVIDGQFAFYQADGMRRFNASDPNKLLPSNVPEGSFIIRAHTPMSNLFSCLWFNEVERFTPRDQLSFAYTYHKLRRMNPEKPFLLNMFKDCERRKIAKLFRHKSEESRSSGQVVI